MGGCVVGGCVVGGCGLHILPCQATLTVALIRQEG